MLSHGSKGVDMGITSYARHAAWRTLHARTRGVREMPFLVMFRPGGGVRSLVIYGDKGGVGERMTLRHREAAKA